MTKRLTVYEMTEGLIVYVYLLLASLLNSVLLNLAVFQFDHQLKHLCSPARQQCVELTGPKRLAWDYYLLRVML